MTDIQMTGADDTHVSDSHSSPDQNSLSVRTDDLQDVDGLDARSTALSPPKKVARCLPPHGLNPFYSEEEDLLISMQDESLQKVEPQILEVEQIPKTPKKVDKAFEDGYNWRKYGQKLVKCNEFIRSYYKCTYSNCSTKRQVERAHDGTIIDIVYLGQHHHPKPEESSEVSICSVLSIQNKKPDDPSLASGNENEVIEAKGHTSLNEQPEIPVASSNSVTESTVSQPFKTTHEDGQQKVKKRKLDAGESRIVVQAQGEVGMVNDGYMWRKYGQKMVKGSPNPRSYYRCRNLSCPVKKHVERDPADPKIVITTYEGQHNHKITPGRIVSPNSAGSSVN